VTLPVPPPTVLGAPRSYGRDAYHWFLRQRWSVSLLVIAAGFLAVNAVFATLYWLTGGIEGSTGWIDDLYFSVQTSATVGYGGMAPRTDLANAMMIGESVISLIVTALATGLVFAKFSRTTARIRFTSKVVVAPIDGVPTLMFRVGNERSGAMIETTIRVTMTRTEITKEGERYYRMYDLALVRDRTPQLTRTWTVMHPLTQWSQLHGVDPATVAAWETELGVSVTGLDETSMQTVHARKLYDHTDILWNHRFADVLTERPDGSLLVDLNNFDKAVPVSV
jgi:inward rectifier potassium channel